MAAVLNYFLLSLLCLSALLCFVFSQNPPGFISLDCGLPMDVKYEELNSGIIYDSDATFIETGTIHTISSNSIKNHNQQLWSLRSFPEGTRNCYKVRVKVDTKYLIRASFLYGDYDGRRKLPSFDLHFGPNFWTSVNLDAIDMVKHLEIIHVVSSNYVEVCLINTGAGTPFISALELRPLNNLSYPTGSPPMSLANFFRFDVGSVNNQTYRYKDDVYDRIWVPMAPIPEWTSTTTPNLINVNDPLFFNAAPMVMNSAATPKDASAPLQFHWVSPTNTAQFFFYMYFTEFLKLQSNESRVFDIILNGGFWHNKSKLISPTYLNEYVVYSTEPLTGGMFNFSIVKTVNSTLPPVLNAIEAYTVINFFLSETNQQDVEGISNIKKVYGVERNWQGDPCAPTEFIWQGLKCSSVDDSEPPRITSLNLSSSGLTGKIAKDIAYLTMLESLDLSNNNLSGTVPNFLVQLPSLRVLNLERNQLSGLIPTQLIEKFNDGTLNLSFGENPNLFITIPSEEKKRNIVVPVLASVCGFVLFLFLIFGVIFWIKTKQIKQLVAVIGTTNQNVDQSQQWSATKQCYSYSDILRMTNNFERPLGEGGFGRVYYGQINNTQVAVKMLSPQSTQGYQQFQTEVDLLMRVHHKNLIGLVGYCNESTNKGLIYEYMENGNLGSLIPGGRSTKVLDWKDRLLIAVDVAHGLEYLHYGIKPAIIHRDVKPTNILLDNNFRAKVADFGLSRVFPMEGGITHVTTTNAVGTHGYIDPEYHSTFRLNEKSDVYGFGVILLEIITGKPALIRTEDEVIHIYQWVKPLFSQGNIQSIIDQKIEGDVDMNSVWKAVDIAMCCVSIKSVDRPNMSQVLVDLKECLAMEFAHHNHSQPDSVVADSSVLFGPIAR